MSQKNKCGQKEKEQSLINGYVEMSEINLSIANMCIDADNEALICIEENLTECE